MYEGSLTQAVLIESEPSDFGEVVFGWTMSDSVVPGWIWSNKMGYIYGFGYSRLLPHHHFPPTLGYYPYNSWYPYPAADYSYVGW